VRRDQKKVTNRRYLLTDPVAGFIVEKQDGRGLWGGCATRFHSSISGWRVGFDR
jgi:hypothetical protein